ncbi:MAG: signal peptide peptidase SppA [Planctomycetes bacterium]|nr:signal peptide peptidase SppA [Planctomycetota bacterium]
MRIRSSAVLFLTTLSFVAPPVSAQQKAAAVILEDVTNAPQEQAPQQPEQVAFLRPAGLYADLPEVGFDPTSLLTGGGAQPKAFFPFLQMVDDLAEGPGSNVLLDLSAGVGFNLAQQREVERAIARVRASGKQITCYLENAGIGAYQLAAQCDRVLLADMGSVDLRSPAMNVMHFKDALDLLGVQVEVTRVGEFKGAVEPYMLPTMSSHLREHYRDMLESMNGDIVRRIANGRGLSLDKVRELQEERLFTAKAALLAGLVDRLVPWEGAERAFATMRGDAPFELEDVAPREKKKRRDLMSMISNMMRSKQEEEIEDPEIVVMHLSGQIVDGNSPAAGSMVSGPSVARLDKLADNDLVKGVVIRINSPGGSATASEAIRLAIARLAKKKPVVFSMGEMAASGGYWITAIGEPILAEVGTITGSIGVFGMRFQPGALMRRLGIHTEIVSIDDGPQMDAMDRPWSPSARAKIQGSVDEIYERFLGIVAQSRGKTAEQVDAIAGGRVWSGEQALQNGLVDEIGGVDKAIAMIRKRAGIEAGSDVEVRHLPQPTNFADAFFGQLFDAKVETVDGALLEALVTRCGRFGEVVSMIREALTSDGSTRIYALMPAGLRVR